MRVLARCTFDDAGPMKGTLAERYFDSRDLWSVATRDRGHSLSSALPAREKRAAGGRRSDALGRSNAITAMQRIF